MMIVVKLIDWLLELVVLEPPLTVVADPLRVTELPVTLLNGLVGTAVEHSP